MFIVFTRLFRHFPNWNGFRMFQISAMININTKFEGSTNRPCAKRNEEQQELRRVSELQSKLLNFGLFVMVVSFCFFLWKRDCFGVRSFGESGSDVWNCWGVRFATSLLFLFVLRPFCPSITLFCKVNTKKNRHKVLRYKVMDALDTLRIFCEASGRSNRWSVMVVYQMPTNFTTEQVDRCNDSSFVRDRTW